MASPKKSPASTWWNGWCGKRPAICRPGFIQHRAARRIDPGAGLCRRPGQGISAILRHAHRGRISCPDEARIETWVERGVEVSPFYDPMLAKIIVHAADREQAMARLLAALDATALHGIETNLDYLKQILRSSAFRGGRHTTSFLNGFHYAAQPSMCSAPACRPRCRTIPGASATGTSACRRPGPMDGLAFRLANRLVGNAEGKAGLEITLAGPTLRFNCDSIIASAARRWTTLGRRAAGAMASRMPVKAGAILQFGKLVNHGCRAYLAVRGGFDVPDYLGSRRPSPSGSSAATRGVRC